MNEMQTKRPRGRPLPNGMTVPEAKERIIRALKNGILLKQAVELAVVSQQSLNNWLNRDEVFRTEVENIRTKVFEELSTQKPTLDSIFRTEVMGDRTKKLEELLSERN